MNHTCSRCGNVILCDTPANRPPSFVNTSAGIQMKVIPDVVGEVPHDH